MKIAIACKFKNTKNVPCFCRLYNSLNLTYPPKLAGMAVEEKQQGDDNVAALNQALHRTVLPEEVNTG